MFPGKSFVWNTAYVDEGGHNTSSSFLHPLYPLFSIPYNIIPIFYLLSSISYPLICVLCPLSYSLAFHPLCFHLYYIPYRKSFAHYLYFLFYPIFSIIYIFFPSVIYVLSPNIYVLSIIYYTPSSVNYALFCGPYFLCYHLFPILYALLFISNSTLLYLYFSHINIGKYLHNCGFIAITNTSIND
jgi:hypothetical protein